MTLLPLVLRVLNRPDDQARSLAERRHPRVLAVGLKDAVIPVGQFAEKLLCRGER